MKYTFRFAYIVTIAFWCIAKYNLRYTKKERRFRVSCFSHFRKDFICPYGLAHTETSFDASTFSRRLNNINCEVYLPPQIAISEFAETISVNLNYAYENLEILDQKSISALIQKFRKIELYLKIFDSKQEDERYVFLTDSLFLYWGILTPY